MKRPITIVVTILLLFTSNLFAQTGRISGQVVDEDNFSLISANVYITSISQGTATDDNGKYLISNLEPGNYEVTFSYLGYQTKKLDAQVESNRTLELNVTLNSGVLIGEEIVVLGDQLKGQAKALNQQKELMNISNIVSADQIGRFPDANVGDALKRIQGITVNYDQGEARFGNIRGTEPRLNSVTINGERIPSAEAGTRSVQLDLVPSDMIQTIEVTKAVTPEMDADAIGGSVNLITKGAPNKLRFSATLGGNYNKLSERAAPNGAFTIGRRFADGMIGVMLNGSYQDHELGSHNTEGKWSGEPGSFSPKDWQVRNYSLRRLRKSIGGTVELNLNQNNRINLRGIYNHRNDWENRFRLRYKKIKADDDGQLLSEVRRQTKGGISDNNNARLEDQKMWTTSLSGEHKIGNLMEVEWSAALSKASEERPNERYISWVAKKTPISLDLTNTNEPKVLENVSYSEFSLKEISEEHKFTDEKDFKAKLNVKIPLIKEGQYKNSLKIGGRYKRKDKKRDNNYFEYEPLTEPENMLAWENKDYSNPNFLAGNYNVGNFTTAEYLGSLDLNNPNLFDKSDVPSEYGAKNYTASEKVLAGYVQLNQNFNKNFSMIAGLRIEKTNVDYRGNQFDEETEKVTPTDGKDSYTNILPGIHFRYNINKNTILRAAWTNTIARPNYYDLVPYRAIGKDNEELAIGNPALDPTTSMNLDLMAEQYLESVGIVSGGVFYKKIDDYIYIYSEKDFNDVTSGNTYDEFFQPRNGASANLFGLEFAFQRRLDFLGEIFNNFNFYSNYTFTKSSTDNPVLKNQVEGDKEIALPGTSPHIVNANLTYQNEKIVLGLSFNYSAAYLDPDELDLTPGLERYYDSVVRIDLNGSYAFTPYLRIFVEANNLTNQPLRYYAGSQDRTYQAEYYNMRFNAGIKLDF